MDVIELFIRCTAEVVLFGDKVFSVKYSAVAESARTVAASYYRRYACALQSCDKGLIIGRIQLINCIAYVHNEIEMLDFINFAVSDGVSLLTDP
jgi:hypothetical protein